MITTKTTLMSVIAAIGIAATLNTAVAVSANAAGAKRAYPSAQKSIKKFVSKPKASNMLQGNGTSSKARECTWTNDNEAVCSEQVGDTLVITCIDKWGKSTGC